MNTVISKHAHCAILRIGLIQTLHIWLRTWAACLLLRYHDDCRRKSNY